ncbi:hypothetical protein E2L07_03015 [Halalkalibacterium halodurans]|uniref:DUF294 nucleotidyltransferase-like domain-containing protein n=1 Tax=Halalkalibacterium halodurans TaxID=86665 RepID=UPI0010673E21|nr:DUF294 nucleotidyltransferase-like domain-containing protein [Halalkalibacterium halodurans]TES57379.1 hypothetical protein E2L07_03015 [Halalkalibacterium halodurans]
MAQKRSDDLSIIRAADSYGELLQHRLTLISSTKKDHQTLNHCHDEIIKQVVALALQRIESEWGAPPTHFVFFVMGSAGRMEQSIWSDQDHGLLYLEEHDDNQAYFLALGREIEEGLAKVGYERCDGLVMASHPRWCCSQAAWHDQQQRWMKENTWEAYRHLLTFFDGRPLVGDANLMEDVKVNLLQRIETNRQLLKRFMQNTERLKKGIGLFGQLLVESKGTARGLFDIKQVTLFPYVNALRLLALKEQITAAPTVARYEAIRDRYLDVYETKRMFEQLLSKRLEWQQDVPNYERIHYLDLTQLTKDERNELKAWTVTGHKLYRSVEEAVKREWSL